ncbi:rubisco accumulation factor 1.1, chloroplastic-like [Wolffia australiana]
MAALSLTPSNPTHVASNTYRRLSSFLPRFARALPTKSPRLRPISAANRPFSQPPPPSGELYQPFRPPPSPIPPKYSSLDTAARIETLRNRLGAWFEYSSLIPALTQDGFTPATLEELSGIPSVEQNCLVVAAQVRDSLQSSNLDPDLLAFFDSGGYDLLYELRLLSASQRVAAAQRVIQQRLSAKGAQELARAIKDFPRRRGDPGWDDFSLESPGDCLAFSYFRLSREAIVDSERRAALERALEAVETEAGRERVLLEMAKKAGESEDEEDEASAQTVPVVRMRYGEVAEATVVIVLPVAESGEGEEGLAAAPACRAAGEFGVVTADKAWRRWVVLPRWEPLALIAAGGGVAVAFPDARVLPWRTNRSAMEEPTLVVVDRTRQEVEEDGFYLVGVSGGAMKVEKGRKLLDEEPARVLGAVALVVRPPIDDMDAQLQDEDWD